MMAHAKKAEDVKVYFHRSFNASLIRSSTKNGKAMTVAKASLVLITATTGASANHTPEEKNPSFTSRTFED